MAHPPPLKKCVKLSKSNKIIEDYGPVKNGYCIEEANIDSPISTGLDPAEGANLSSREKPRFKFLLSDVPTFSIQQ